MNISTWKSIVALLTGGVKGLLKYGITAINTQVLANIKNKEDVKKYLLDVQLCTSCISGIVDNHKDDISDTTKESMKTIVEALDSLAKALEDFEVNETEINEIVDKIKIAIDSFRK